MTPVAGRDTSSASLEAWMKLRAIEGVGDHLVLVLVRSGRSSGHGSCMAACARVDGFCGEGGDGAEGNKEVRRFGREISSWGSCLVGGAMVGVRAGAVEAADGRHRISTSKPRRASKKPATRLKRASRAATSTRSGLSGRTFWVSTRGCSIA